MSTYGKCLHIWKIKDIEGGDFDLIAETAGLLGVDRISVKAANGTALYNQRWTGFGWADDLLPPFVEHMQAAGFMVYGWHYLYGFNPVGEFDAAMKRIALFDGYEWDAEGYYKNKHNQAETFAGLVAAEGIDKPLGLCSYRFPDLHPEVPWDAFLSISTYHAPQVYWNPPNEQLEHGPIPELDKSIEQLKAIKDLQVVPVGRAYIGDGYPDPGPTYDEVTEFMDHCKRIGLPGFSLWSWDALGSHNGGAERMAAFGDFIWDAAPGKTLEERVTILELEARLHGWNV
jgi:hypothetical protein